MAAELIRRGLPVEYASRAAAELADHHQELVEELRATGLSDSQASKAASRRLGEPHMLVKKTVYEYQRRYWCGRWPLITFLLGPVSMLLSVWLATALTLAAIGWFVGLFVEETRIEAFESVAQYAIAYSLKIWLTFVSPVLVIAAMCWLAARAALSRAWMGVASVMMASFIGFVSCKFEFKSATNPTGRFTIGYDFWFLAENFNAHLIDFFSRDMWQISQLVLPLAATLLCGLYFRARASAEAQELMMAR
jgi:hypothetical protein